MLSRRTWRPSGNTPTFEPAASTACRVTRTLAFGGSACTVSSAVIILLRLAMRRRASGLRCHRTAPVSRLNSRPARGGLRKRSESASPAGAPIPLSCSGGVPSDSPIGERAVAGGEAACSAVAARACAGA